MTVPFLLSHSCAPLQFTLAAPLTPVSIRDQMIRGKMFVDRAFEHALISSARPLLVNGGWSRWGYGSDSSGRSGSSDDSGGDLPSGLRATEAGTTRWVDPTQI